MSIDPQQERTLGQLVASAAEDLSTLVRGEIALAKAEVSLQAKKAGRGGALLAAAAVVGFYSVYFIFTTLAEGIQALGLPRWLSFLIVTVVMLLIAGVLGLLGWRKMRTVEPKPEKTIDNAQRTVAGIKAAVANPGTVTPAPRPTFSTPRSAVATTRASATTGTSATTAAHTAGSPRTVGTGSGSHPVLPDSARDA